MKSISAIIFTIILFCTGCDTDNTPPPIEGKWVTQACEQTSDSPNPGLSRWSKGTYEFTTERELLIGSISYTDADCITHISTQAGTIANTQISFSHLGATSVEEGVEAFGLSLLPYRDDRETVYDGVYTINNNILCLSETFSFGVTGYHLSGLSGEPDKIRIDFTKCLEKP